MLLERKIPCYLTFLNVNKAENIVFLSQCHTQPPLLRTREEHTNVAVMTTKG